MRPSTGYTPLPPLRSARSDVEDFDADAPPSAVVPQGDLFDDQGFNYRQDMPPPLYDVSQPPVAQGKLFVDNPFYRSVANNAAAGPLVVDPDGHAFNADSPDFKVPVTKAIMAANQHSHSHSQALTERPFAPVSVPNSNAQTSNQSIMLQRPASTPSLGPYIYPPSNVNGGRFNQPPFANGQKDKTMMRSQTHPPYPPYRQPLPHANTGAPLQPPNAAYQQALPGPPEKNPFLQRSTASRPPSFAHAGRAIFKYQGVAPSAPFGGAAPVGIMMPGGRTMPGPGNVVLNHPVVTPPVNNGKKRARTSVDNDDDLADRINTTHGKSRNRRRAQNTELKEAPPVSAPMPLCGIGAKEICYFIPNATQWPDVLLRLLGNKWTAEHIAKAQLYARDLATEERVKTRYATIRQQKKNLAIQYGGNIPKPLPATQNWDARGYNPRPGMQQDAQPVSLIDLADGVVNFPTGEDKGVLTQCILQAKADNNHQLTTAHIPAMVAFYRFVMPAEAQPGATVNWDTNARDRMRDEVDLLLD